MQITLWQMIRYKLSKPRKFPPNPIYRGNVAPGVGRTVKPPYRFKTLELYRYYWATQIGETSKNIHR